MVKLCCLTNRKSWNQLWQLGSVHEICIFLRGHVSFHNFKGDKLWNLNLKLPETRAFKGTCYVTKKSCTDVRNPTIFWFFWVTSHFKIVSDYKSSITHFLRVRPIVRLSHPIYLKTKKIVHYKQINAGIEPEGAKYHIFLEDISVSRGREQPLVC